MGKHSGVSRQGIKSLGLILLFCSWMLFFRLLYTWSWEHIFLLWNLFLAILPLYIAEQFSRSCDKKGFKHPVTISFFIAWLLFFPNAPYIITDLIHIAYSARKIPLWYDALMIFTFAFAGVYAGYCSLLPVLCVLKERFRKYGEWVFLTFLFILSGYGVYLGRVLRWNSWDALFRPHLVASSILENIFDLAAWGITVFFGSFLFLGWLIFKLLVAEPLNKNKNESRKMP